jgi:U3 small nucleolar RNA-associated protein 12
MGYSRRDRPFSVCDSHTKLSVRAQHRHRLRGHRDQITNIRFLSRYPSTPSTSTGTSPGLLMTSSKDTFVKLWDLSTQHCVQTIVAHRAEVWSLCLNSEQDLLLTGSNEGELKAWKIEPGPLLQGIKESGNGDVRYHVLESLISSSRILSYSCRK